ncbi:metal-sensitive transcriptional regulator [Marinilactibacillus piezotolerans]|uniref:metal-sensitive transcriptional regulator n=1 Tax=Marinilactibacillus piezotolerans TaxID=258723 RepID=UPI0009B007B6|nr:metal-sensitive transcriptional regulator [Marinilactibacillus piezotolerans]
MEYNAKIVNRLKRSKGQLEGVLNMIDDEKDCAEIVTQLTAVRSSLDRAIGLIVAENLLDCIQNNKNENEDFTEDERIQQAIKLLMKSR